MTNRKLFGTDGIRGHVNSPELQPEYIVGLGRVLGGLAKTQLIEGKSTIAVGRDTRASGEYLEQALIAGITAVGVDCKLVGVLPTAALAFVTKHTGCQFGVMISASHNPYFDNGLKIFDAQGFKLDKNIEQTIEEQLNAITSLTDIKKTSVVAGKTIIETSAVEEYCKVITARQLQKRNTLKLVIDCAHGAAFRLAPHIFQELGLNIALIGASPNGNNINESCGSEWPRVLQNEVLRHNADLGIAFDGDADRVIFVDEHGQIIDGDAIIAILGRDLKNRGLLKNDMVVATVMSSVALDKALAEEKVRVMRTLVGDKFVAQAMLKHELTFGGENSGHLIVFPDSTTGDGILSALHFIDILERSKQTASQLASFYQPTPKLLKNINVTKKVPLEYLPLTNMSIMQANNTLSPQGRVMLRYSGTENKARLLVEASTEAECRKISDDISIIFDQELQRVAF